MRRNHPLILGFLPLILLFLLALFALSLFSPQARSSLSNNSHSAGGEHSSVLDASSANAHPPLDQLTAISSASSSYDNQPHPNSFYYRLPDISLAQISNSLNFMSDAPVKTFSNIEKYNVLQDAMLAHGLQEQQLVPGYLSKSYIIFATSGGRAEESRRANPMALVAGLQSPCLWGSFSSRISCFSGSVKPCKLHELNLMVDSYRMNSPTQCNAFGSVSERYPDRQWTVTPEVSETPQCGTDQVVQARNPRATIYKSHLLIASVFPVLAYHHSGDILDPALLSRATYITRVLLDAVIKTMTPSSHTFQFVALTWSHVPPSQIKLQTWTGLPNAGPSAKAWEWAIGAILNTPRWETPLRPIAFRPQQGWELVLNAREVQYSSFFPLMKQTKIYKH